jgi:hypothetical protein
MNINTLKAFVSRFLLHPIIRASIYYSFLLIAFFFLFIGIAVIFGVHDERQVIGWIIFILGVIPVVLMIKFQGWFFPKTENSELKQPKKLLFRIAYIARSFLLLIAYYIMYFLCFVVFYILHFAFIHHMPWLGVEGAEVLYDWCPLGEHTYHLSKETSNIIVFFPIVVSIVSTIVFNHTNRIVRLILFLLPIAGIILFLFLHFMCIGSIHERSS